jgi:hypothetical protein
MGRLSLHRVPASGDEAVQVCKRRDGLNTMVCISTTVCSAAACCFEQRRKALGLMSAGFFYLMKAWNSYGLIV